MFLILAIVRDEDAVICGLAKTYHLFDMKSVRPSIAGTLLAGLNRPTTEQVLIASCCDRLSNIAWMLSDDGQKRINQPKSLVKVLMGEEDDAELTGYDSPEDFWEAMEKYGSG